MSREKLFYVYIVASGPNETLYTGMTNHIARRAYEHRHGMMEGFTTRYGVKRLVYVVSFPTAHEAIQHEKRPKRYSRAWKINVIRERNPEWRDLYDSLNG